MKILIIILLCIGIPVVAVLLIGILLPVKHSVSRSEIFAAAPAVVWNVITAPPDWRPEVVRFETIAGGDQARVWKEYDKRGRAITYEAIESQANRRLITRIADKTLPFGGTWTYDLTPDGEGTRLTITEDGEVYNPVFRFVSRFVFGHTAQIDTYLRDLKTRLEKQDGTDSRLHG